MSKCERRLRGKKQQQLTPEDPNDPVYLRICFVCAESAKPGHDHYRNYGGVVCYSCRAFWRRSHQKTRTPAFTCKKSGKCVTSMESRKKCKKCRYMRCLKAGMRPDAVLDVNQKKIRFRKHLQNVSKSKTRETEGSPEEEESSDEETSEEETRQGSLTTTKSDDSLGATNTNLESKSLESNLQNRRFSEECLNLHEASKHLLTVTFKPETTPSTPSGLPFSPIDQEGSHYNLSLKAKSIIRSYIISHSKSKFAQELDFIRKIKAFGNGDMSVMIEKNDLFHLISIFFDDLKQFSHQLWQFNVLNKSDQHQLLMKNAPLFVQLFLSFYLLSPEDLKDSKVSSFDDTNLKKTWILNFLQNLHLEAFNMKTNFFRSGSDLNTYARLLIRLKGLPSLELFETRAIIAFLILFNTSHDSIDLDSEKLVKEANTLSGMLYNKLVRKDLEVPSIERCIKTLSQMVYFCSYNVNWSNSRTEALPYLSDLSVSYSEEEESWLKLQIQATTYAIQSVSVPVRLIRSYALHTQGYPLEESHMEQYFRIMHERLFRILEIHQSFSELSSATQRSLMVQNSPDALSLMVVKAESCRNVEEQLQEGCGIEDKLQWDQDFLPFIGNLDFTLKASLLDDVNILHGEKATEFKILIEAMKILVEDPVLYKLMLLIVLTSPLKFGKREKDLSPLYWKYRVLLTRRLTWMASIRNVEPIHSQIFCQLGKLSQITKLLSSSIDRKY